MGEKKQKEIVVISGKGGTGKTSLTACFAALAKKAVTCDCDVDAADLHLVLSPTVKDRGLFSGGVTAEIDQEKCIRCGKCKDACRFSAIEIKEKKFYIDPLACEGCGVCKLVCPAGAVKTKPAINGEWFVSETRFGPMSHAKLGIAEENSGRLVTLVRQKASGLSSNETGGRIISDGAPGTGCPVIASLTGVNYALVVTEPTVSGLHDMERILDVTEHFRVPSGVVVNKYDLNLEMTDKIKEIVKRRGGISYMGEIPYDKNVTLAQMQRMSLVEYGKGKALESVKQIWEKIRAQEDL
ncbi:MAG: ATP-binding protein [Candidatus Margulisiibacteriota bacterium]